MDPLSASTSSAMKRFHPDPGALIAAVRARPCLWRRDHAQYRRRGAKERAWRDVCAALHPAYHLLDAADKHELGIIIMRKWYNIRDAYRKTYISKHSRPYVHRDQLTFLDPCFGEGERPGRARSSPGGEGERAGRGRASPGAEGERAGRARASPGGEEPAEGEEWLSVLELEEEAPAAKRTKTVEYNHSTNKDEPDESLVSVLVNLMEKEDDEDRAFFRSITPTVKALSDEDKFLFRIQVMKLLNSFRKKSRTFKIEALCNESDGDDELA